MNNSLQILSTSQVKIFVVSMVLMFLVVVLKNLGFTTQTLVNPMPIEVNIMDTIRPRLEQKINNFKIHKQTSLIGSVSAGSDYAQATAYAVVDFSSGEVMLEKNLSRKLPIASITKTMTAVVVLDLVSPSDIFTASEKAANIEPTRMGVIPGHKYSVEELLNALLLTSANDAGEVLKEGIDRKYGEQIFIRAMNEKAKFLGLSNTSFDNPQGYDGRNNYSSVEDLSLLIHYALTNYTLIAQIVTKDYQFYSASENHKQIDLYNWNGLLGVYPGVSGVKIGNTGRAGYTTAVVSEREGQKLIAVLLGAPGVLERDLWTSQILDLGFEKKELSPVNISPSQLREKYASWRYW